MTLCKSSVTRLIYNLFFKSHSSPFRRLSPIVLVCSKTSRTTFYSVGKLTSRASPRVFPDKMSFAPSPYISRLTFRRRRRRPRRRRYSRLILNLRLFVLHCLRKIIVPIICWVTSETLNRQCSTSESLSNLEASFGLISRFESIAHHLHIFFYFLLILFRVNLIT